METAFVMECEEEELEPAQHEDELEEDDELDTDFLPVQTLQNGNREQGDRRRKKLSAMDEFEVALSEEVRKHKHLYNSSLKDHKDSRLVNSSWREIADTLSADATYCKKRWQNLRDKFTKARRRMMSWRSPGGKNRVPVLYTVLRWLDGHVKPKASIKMTISQAETQEQPSPSCHPISRSPSTDIELELSTVNTDEFDCSLLDTPSPAPSPVPAPVPAPAPAPSIPVPPPRPPPTPPHPPPTLTPTASSRPVPPPLPATTDVPTSCPFPSITSCPGPSTTSCLGPSTTSCPGPSTTSCPGPSTTSCPGPSPTSCPGASTTSYPGHSPTSCPGTSTTSCPEPSTASSPGPSTTSCPGPSTMSCPGPSTTSCPEPSTASSPGPSTTSSPGRSAPRSRKRRRASEPEGLNYESLFAALDQRRAEREAAMEAGRERRTAVIVRLLEQQDECDRYVLHVADFMRSLPPDHLSEFKFKLQNLMRETEQAVKNNVENGLAAVQTEHQNGEER